MFRILYRFLADLARLAVRSGRSKDLEIIVLRHQLTVLRRQVERPTVTDGDRTLLGAIAAALPKALRQGWIVTPETLLRWHRRRIARHWTQPPTRRTGRPPTPVELSELILRLARETPTWGYRRIQGELLHLGHKIAKTTVWQILKDNGIDPSPNRSNVTWTGFLHSQAAVACDFFTVDTAFLRRYYVLFFINVNTREVIFAGITANPTGPWTTQAARNLFLRHGEQLADSKALVRHRGSHFTANFDAVFRYEGLKILKTPIRRELLNNPHGCPVHIIWNRRQLERLVIDYIAHHNEHRPHQSLDQRPPSPVEDPPDSPAPTVTVLRTTRCDGLINEYQNAA